MAIWAAGPMNTEAFSRTRSSLRSFSFVCASVARSVTQVSAFSQDGRRVRFPTAILQPFVTREGIRGSFAIHFDAEHKFVNIVKVG